MEKRKYLTLLMSNRFAIRPFKSTQEVDRRPVLGAEFFPKLYSSIFILGKTGSGKTIVAQNILRECVGPKTMIYAFSGSINSDQRWIDIQNWAKQHKIAFHGYDTIKHKTQYGIINRVGELMKALRKEAEMRLEQEEAKRRAEGLGLDTLGMDPEDIDEDMPEYERVINQPGELDIGEPTNEEHPSVGILDNKPSCEVEYPFQSPDYILILDDCSRDLRNDDLTTLLKSSRHFRMKVLLLSQHVKDLMPAAISQLSYLLLFGGLGTPILKKILEDTGMDISLPLFETFYKKVTAGDGNKHNFLYIDIANVSFRKNFAPKLTYKILPQEGCGKNEENFEDENEDDGDEGDERDRPQFENVNRKHEEILWKKSKGIR